MSGWLRARRVRRYKIRAWKQYDREVANQHLLMSFGLGKPYNVEAPDFDDPRVLA